MRRAELITNYEALQCLQSKNKLREVIGDHSDEIKWLREKVTGYLNDTVASEQDAEGIQAFIQAIRTQFVGPSKLTTAETLQLVNLAPRTEAEVHLIIEQCGERLTDENVLTIVTLVSQHLRGNSGE